MQFEWDERKRFTNLEKHGLDFLDAIIVFENPHVVVPSTNSDEPRFLAIGMLQGRFVTVIYTLRSETIRIISFRRSHHEERRKYHALFGE
jgi:uncharacterized protein